MMHLDDGRLQAYLDDEIPGRDRVAAAEHILRCGDCRAELDELREANRVFAGAVAELDVEPAAAAPPAGRPGRTYGVGSIVRAAVLVLLFAAAASAVVPGSPVPGWIAGALGDAPEAPAATAPAPDPVVVEPAPAEPAQPAGISLPVDGRIEIAIEGMQDVTIRLVRGADRSVSVSAVGGERDPVFRTEAGRIEVADGAGGDIVVEFPSGGDARLLVDGRPYAEQTAGRLTLLVPGEDTDDGVVWR